VGPGDVSKTNAGNAFSDPLPASRTIKFIVVVLVYVALGRLGQEIVVQRVTPVWAASGLALAALLLGGSRIWPAIAIGSLAVNLLWSFDTHRAVSSLLATAGMAAGATLEALTGVFLIHKYAGKIRSLHRVSDVFKFVLFGALISPIIAATFGTSSLAIFELLPWPEHGSTWLTWWMGDMAGIMIITPLILAWYNKQPVPWNCVRIAEVVMLSLVILFVARITFHGNYRLEYMFIPCLVWAAFRFGERGATTFVLFILTIAVWETMQRNGPFFAITLNESLLTLQAFMVVMVMTSLVLTSVLHERSRRNQELMDARILAEEANRAKSIFLATMSHELRTPLNHILGYAELLEETAAEEGRQESIQDLEKIRSAGKHLLTMIEHVLDYTKLETGKVDLQLEQIDLQTLVREIESEIRPLAEKNQNQFEISIEPALCLKSDRAKVRQLLLNEIGRASCRERV